MVGYCGRVPEQELAIQIGDVYCIHVNHMNVCEPRQGQILEEFASQATRSDTQHTDVLGDEAPKGWIGHKVAANHTSLSGE